MLKVNYLKHYSIVHTIKLIQTTPFLLSTGSIRHEGRVMSNAQALLQNAWLGDAVSVKKRMVSFLLDNCNMELSAH